MAKNTPLESLARQWTTLKDAEDSARAERHEVEERIALLLPGADESIVHEEAGRYKVSLTRKYTRSIDTDAYAPVKDLIPQHLNPVRLKPDLDLKLYRALERGNPDIFAVVQTFVSIKPAKVAVKIEEV